MTKTETIQEMTDTEREKKENKRGDRERVFSIKINSFEIKGVGATVGGLSEHFKFSVSPFSLCPCRRPSPRHR